MAVIALTATAVGDDAPLGDGEVVTTIALSSET